MIAMRHKPHHPSVEAVADRYHAETKRLECVEMEQASAVVAEKVEVLREQNHFVDLITRVLAGR